MRKFLMAAALLAIPAAVSAQSANATINARVWMPLSVTATQGTLDLGLAIQGAGTTLTVLPTASGPTNPAAAFTITGQPTAAVTLTQPASATLAGPNGGSLTFNAAWASHDANVQGSQTAGATPSVSLNASGNYYVWLGGSTNTSAITAAQTGTYTGSITLSVSY